MSVSTGEQSQLILTMVGENFKLYCSEMLQNEGALLIVRKTFTMVEENFDFSCSEMLQNERYILILRESFHHV